MELANVAAIGLQSTEKHIADKDNHVAALLLHNEIGKYIALGGNARHLKEAVARMEQATKVAKDHPAVQRILNINEAGKKRRSGK